jgi:hypothetical protein
LAKGITGAGEAIGRGRERAEDKQFAHDEAALARDERARQEDKLTKFNAKWQALMTAYSAERAERIRQFEFTNAMFLRAIGPDGTMAPEMMDAFEDAYTNLRPITFRDLLDEIGFSEDQRIKGRGSLSPEDMFGEDLDRPVNSEAVPSALARMALAMGRGKMDDQFRKMAAKKLAALNIVIPQMAAEKHWRPIVESIKTYRGDIDVSDFYQKGPNGEIDIRASLYGAITGDDGLIWKTRNADATRILEEYLEMDPDDLPPDLLKDWMSKLYPTGQVAQGYIDQIIDRRDDIDVLQTNAEKMNPNMAFATEHSYRSLDETLTAFITGLKEDTHPEFRRRLQAMRPQIRKVVSATTGTTEFGTTLLGLENILKSQKVLATYALTMPPAEFERKVDILLGQALEEWGEGRDIFDALGEIEAESPTTKMVEEVEAPRWRAPSVGKDPSLDPVQLGTPGQLTVPGPEKPTIPGFPALGEGETPTPVETEGVWDTAALPLESTFEDYFPLEQEPTLEEGPPLPGTLSPRDITLPLGYQEEVRER